jgi:hypothetical protein
VVGLFSYNKVQLQLAALLCQGGILGVTAGLKTRGARVEFWKWKTTFVLFVGRLGTSAITVGPAFLRGKDLWRWGASEPTARTASALRRRKRAAPTQKPS